MLRWLIIFTCDVHNDAHLKSIVWSLLTLGLCWSSSQSIVSVQTDKYGDSNGEVQKI